VNDIFKNFKENIEILKGLLTVANFNSAISTSRLDSISTQEKVNVLKLHSDKFLLSLQNLALSKNIELIQSQARYIAYK
jgi:hypothetical protein